MFQRREVREFYIMDTLAPEKHFAFSKLGLHMCLPSGKFCLLVSTRHLHLTLSAYCPILICSGDLTSL